MSAQIQMMKAGEKDAIGNRRKIRKLSPRRLGSEIVGETMCRMYPDAVEVLESLFAQADERREPLVVLSSDPLWEVAGFDEVGVTDSVLLRRYCAAKGYPIALARCGLIVPPRAQPLSPITAEHLVS